MYPVFRVAAQILRNRKAPHLPMTGTHVSQHICWPWDIDVFWELNNGRTLTLYDLGRFALFQRLGIYPAMKARGWGGTVAGASVRYRRRVRAFDRFELRSRMIGWDARFIYVEQSMWVRGDCSSHGLLRLAITDRAGIVPAPQVAETLGVGSESPPLPTWVEAWIAAEAARPWPPMQDAVASGAIAA